MALQISGSERQVMLYLELVLLTHDIAMEQHLSVVLLCCEYRFLTSLITR